MRGLGLRIYQHRVCFHSFGREVGGVLDELGEFNDRLVKEHASDAASEAVAEVLLDNRINEVAHEVLAFLSSFLLSELVHIDDGQEDLRLHCLWLRGSLLVLRCLAWALVTVLLLHVSASAAVVATSASASLGRSLLRAAIVVLLITTLSVRSILVRGRLRLREHSWELTVLRAVDEVVNELARLLVFLALLLALFLIL